MIRLIYCNLEGKVILHQHVLVYFASFNAVSDVEYMIQNYCGLSKVYNLLNIFRVFDFIYDGSNGETCDV